MSIVADGVSVRLGRRAVVHGATLALRGGEMVGIVGPNGAGKSTLLRALLGLVPVAGGGVAVDGVALAAWNRRALARRVAYLPQGQTLHWPLSVERLVALGRMPHLAPMSRIAPVDTQAIDRAIDRADIAGLRGRTATELSGGERARVLLARALAVEAPALVADEPLAALDPGHQIDVMAMLSREAGAGALVVVVLHDLTMAARHCDRLVLMHEGRIVADDTPVAVLTPQRLAQVYGIAARIDTVDGAPLIVPMRRVD